MKNFYKLKIKNFLKSNTDKFFLENSLSWQTYSVNYQEWLEPETIYTLNSLSVFPDKAYIFKAPPMSILPIHIDGNQNSSRVWAINIVWGSNNHNMHWYKIIRKSNIVLHTQASTPYLMFNKDDVEEVENVSNLVGPTLVRINVPHSVSNYDNKIRYCFSLRCLSKNDTWEKIIDQFKFFID